MADPLQRRHVDNLTISAYSHLSVVQLMSDASPHRDDQADAMSAVIARPKQGLGPAAALARWSDESLYAELVALAGSTDLPCIDSHTDVRDPTNAKAYRTKREAAEHAFVELLRDGAVLSSAFAKGAGAREMLHPSVWEVVELYYDLDEAIGGTRKYECPEFFELSAIPLNIGSRPSWLDEMLAGTGVNVFRPSNDYRHVVLHGREYSLSPLHAGVVRILHQALLAGNPWCNGKQVLKEAQSDQIKMVDVFKSRPDWRDLIDSDGNGSYRLRIDAPREKPNRRIARSGTP